MGQGAEDLDQQWAREVNFEPALRPHNPTTDELAKFEDKDLLAELRRRGRLMRLNAHCVIPGHAVEMGYPVENQLREATRMLADDLARRHWSGERVFDKYAVERKQDPAYPSCFNRDLPQVMELELVLVLRKPK